MNDESRNIVRSMLGGDGSIQTCAECECPAHPLTDEDLRVVLKNARLQIDAWLDGQLDIPEIVMTLLTFGETLWKGQRWAACACRDGGRYLVPPTRPRLNPAQPAERDGDLPAPERGVSWLYRLHGEGGRLLYVGVSNNLPARVRTHRSTFTGLIQRVTFVRYEDRRAALDAELAAIANEMPAFNVVGS